MRDLSEAINSGNLNQVKRILDSENASEKDTALLLASLKGKTNIVKALLEMGVNPNTAAQSKATPLGLSVAFPVIQKMLLEHGANPNQIINNNGDTPLFQAVAQNKIASIMLLMNAGGDVNHKNSTGTTPFLLAIERSMNDIAIKMLDKGANPHNTNIEISPLQFACSDNPISMPLVKKLLEKGADPNYVGEGEKTALHIATQLQNKELIELLLEFGADPNIKDVKNHTPLYYAGPLKYLFHTFPNEYNFMPIEAGNENSLQEDMENGNIVAMLDPAFPEQRIVVKRNGKVTPGWKYLFEERKNPLTRQNVNISHLTFKKAVRHRNQTNRKLRKSRKSRKTRRQQS